MEFVQKSVTLLKDHLKAELDKHNYDEQSKHPNAINAELNEIYDQFYQHSLMGEVVGTAIWDSHWLLLSCLFLYGVIRRNSTFMVPVRKTRG